MQQAPKSVVVLTGAGISAESGIDTFRTAGGLWEKHRIEDVATPEGFHRDPRLVYEFYNQRREKLLDNKIRPNAAHIALAEFERRFQGDIVIVTQNIDNLHERAGSRDVVHMHGELLKMRCQISERVFPIREAIRQETPCPCCRQAGNLRPHVVWFGEMPLFMPRISQALESCQMFIAIGTSGNVYPAAGFREVAQARGAQTVEINLDKTGSRFDQHIYGPATRTVPEYLAQLLARS